jgi:hypothetical protein
MWRTGATKQTSRINHPGLSTSQSLNPFTLSSSFSSIKASFPLKPVPDRLGGNGGPESTKPFFAGIEGGCLLERLLEEACRDDITAPGAAGVAIDRRGGGTVGGEAGFDAIEKRRSLLPSKLPGEAGVLRVLGFLGIGGAGLRCIDDTDDIERDRIEGGDTEIFAVGTSIG